MPQFAPSTVLPQGRFSWKLAKTPLSGYDDFREISITPDTIQPLISELQILGTRWLIEVIPQITRALSRPNSNGKAILALGMCKKGDCLAGNFEDPTSRTEEILSTFEVPGGPSVVLIDMRQDCILCQKETRNGKTKEGCLSIDTKEEFERCLELVIHEIEMATNIFGLEFESIFSFSHA